MRIGMTGCVLGGGKSGVGVWVNSLLKHLALMDKENEYEVAVSQGEEQLVPSRFRLHKVSAYASQAVPNILWQNMWLPFLAKARGWDLVHIPTIRRIPLIKGCPVIATVHDMAPFKIVGKYDKYRMFYHRQILHKLVHRADRIITVSHHTKEDLIQLTGYPSDCVQVIYPGVDHEIFRPRKQKVDIPYIVYVSRIEHPAKNHVRLIEAFARFKQSRQTEHQLIFAGSDWQSASFVKEQASRSPYASEIHFPGFVPIEEMVALYSNADLVVYPSLYEGFGLPVIEAMACGAPVACSNTSSLREIGSNRALLFDPESVDAIAGALEKGLADPFQSKARKEGIEWASRFMWDKTARQVLELYREVAG